MSNGHLNVHSSNGQIDIPKCPRLDMIRPMDEWTYPNVHWTFDVQSSNGRMDMSNASITGKHLSAEVPHHELLHNSFQ